MKKRFVVISILALFLLPLISAYGSWGFGNFGYYNSPLDVFENEWIMFAILVAVFFAAIYYTLFKAFKKKGIAAVISIGLSILITVAIMQRGLIQSYGGGEISSWALFIAAVVGIGFLIRFSSESFGKIGVIIFIIGIWLILNNFYAEELLPDTLTNIPAVLGFYEFFIKNVIGLLIFAGLGFVFGGEGSRTVGDGLARLLGRRTR